MLTWVVIFQGAKKEAFAREHKRKSFWNPPLRMHYTNFVCIRNLNIGNDLLNLCQRKLDNRLGRLEKRADQR